MTASKLLAAALLGACSIASAQDVLLSGHVQRVILQPPGTDNCPPVCPVNPPAGPDGIRQVCVSNAGGCQTLELKVEHVYRGEASGNTRRFTSRIGEWGHTFPVTDQPVIVSEDAGGVSWSALTRQGGKLYVDPKSLRSVGGVRVTAAVAVAGDGELVALDEVLARVAAGR